MSKSNHLVVSQSRVKLWNNCKRAHYNRYILNLTKKKIRRPFQFGRLMHLLIETDANGDEWDLALEKFEVDNAKQLAANAEDYGNLVEDARLIFQEYLEHWDYDEGLIYLRRDKRNAEHPFEVEIEDGISFKGVIDAVTKTRGMRWVTEHKTFGARIPGEDERWRSIQSAVYMRVVEIMGWWNPDGMLWNYVLSKAPPMPKLTKTGALSRAKDSATLPLVAQQFAEENNFDLGDEFLARCEEYRTKYFQRIFSPVSRTVVDFLFDSVIVSAREISENPQADTMNIGRHCSFCDFEMLCRAEIQGSDVDYLKEREYVARKEKPEEDRSFSAEDAE